MANLVLIGPMNVGKSTTAAWIARATRAPRLSLDDRGQPWHRDKQAAYTQARAFPPSDAENDRLFKLAEALSVEQCLRSANETVIDFGAGHSVYRQPELFEMVRSALEGHRIVLLLPSIDLEISRQTLYERCRHDLACCDLTDFFLENPSNRKLAQVVIYTNGKTPIEVANEVLERVPDWAARKSS